MAKLKKQKCLYKFQIGEMEVSLMAENISEDWADLFWWGTFTDDDGTKCSIELSETLVDIVRAKNG